MNKRIAFINSYNVGSTGKIVCDIADSAEKRGYKVLKCFPNTAYNKKNKKDDQFLFGKPIFYKINIYLTMFTGLYGFFQIFNTSKLIKELKNFKPEIIHLNNLHSSFVNLSMLFSYIKKNDIKIVWTTHDCWLFTGHCAYFDIVNCEKWKTLCYNCPNYKAYPKAFIDTSKLLWKKKKKWFGNIKTVVLVTPSKWINDLVKQSFLKNYPAKIINNGIDLSIFKPTPSNIREKYNIPENKKILLGVAFDWGYKKGLDVFTELSKRLDDSKYQIVLAGTNDHVDKQLPSNIISIHRTQNQTELAKIYTAADLFINPTREEMFGLVNIEALACGTPVITFDTGGSPECIDENSGIVIEKNDIQQMQEEIIKLCKNNPYSTQACINRAKLFNNKDKFNEYVDLFDSLL